METDIALKLRALIEKNGISDSALARAIGVAPSAIRRWTMLPAEYPKGESVRRPTVPQLLKLAKHFRVTMEYLADQSIPTDSLKMYRDEHQYILGAFAAFKIAYGPEFTWEEAMRRLVGGTKEEQDQQLEVAMNEAMRQKEIFRKHSMENKYTAE